MKIRIKGNSLRYRLTKSDVKQLNENGHLEEYSCIGEQVLIYALQRNNGHTLSAKFTNNTITVFMPGALLQEWVLTDRVGFEGNDNGLFILIEKDFTCLDNVAEDQSDNYPNPLLNDKSY